MSSFKGKRILAIDDEADVVMIIRTALQTEGYEVATATNGPDALEEAKANPPDLVILDITMPGMDGFEVLRELKAIDATSQVPVIMLTGVSERAKIKDALSSGVDYYVVKPFDFDDLMQKVEQALSGFDN